MFHVQPFEPHTCIVTKGFGALEMHLLLLLVPSKSNDQQITLFENDLFQLRAATPELPPDVVKISASDFRRRQSVSDF